MKKIFISSLVASLLVGGAVTYNIIIKQRTQLELYASNEKQVKEILDLLKTIDFSSGSTENSPGVVQPEEPAITPIPPSIMVDGKEYKDIPYTGTPENIRTLMYIIGEIESRHRYTIVNRAGYAGAYQFGKYGWIDANNEAIRLGLIKHMVKYDKRGRKFYVSKKIQDLVMYAQIKLKARQLKSVGIKPTLFTIYGAHQQGFNGFKNLYLLARDGYVKGLSPKAKLRLIAAMVNNIPRGKQYVTGKWYGWWRTYTSGLITTINENGGKLPKGALTKASKNASRKILK